MKIYLVGGAVRDQLLGLPVKEKDWVVVGATVDEMLKQGYRQVGKDFPVFLHPKTNEEYALARIERKVGRGYTGFQFDTAPTVTLEEDLLRRDLTINAIAQHADGSLVDPYHGKKDLDQKILRHVSPAFAEDPVRILRVARFAARFAALGFSIAPDTMQLMKNMVNAGEVDALVAERVWKELERGLQEKNPQEFFSVLAACAALPVLFPDIQAKNISALQNIAALTADGEIRFAALCYDLSSTQINALAERYRVPTSYRQLALLVATHYPDYLRAKDLSAEPLLDLLQALDAFRRPERFKKFLQTCAGLVSSPKASLWLTEAYLAANAIDALAIASTATKGPEIAAKIKAHRLDCIKKFLASTP